MKICGYQTHPVADVHRLLDQEELQRLAESIREDGQVNDIWLVAIDGKTFVLDGRNRLLATKIAKVEPRTRFYKGPADLASLLAFSRSLNEARRHDTIEQRALAAARAEPLYARAAKERQREAGRRKGKANLPEARQARDEAAAAHGVSPRTVQHGKTVIERADPSVVRLVERGAMKVSAGAELAERPVAEQREIAARLEKGGDIRSGHVRALLRQNQRRETVEKINREKVPPLPIGPFRVFSTDFPWPYENSDGHLGSRGHIDYPPMPIDEICRFRDRVLPALHDDCIWWCWTTNLFMKDTPRVIAEWGFEWISMSTWTKNKAGMGSNAPRGRTEHVVLAMRGRPVHTLNEVSTWIGDRELDVREHSRKPDAFYEMVEKHCAGSKLELFAREPREGWQTWGAESEKFAEHAA